MKTRGSVVAAVLLSVAVLLFAFLLGYSWTSLGEPSRLLAELRSLPARLTFAAGESAGRKGLPTIQTYSEVLTELETRHYEKLNPLEITYAALTGMMGALEDPYTRFMTPKMWASMQEETAGDYVGVGATLEPSPLGAIIRRPLPDSPCIKAGVRPNDLIVSVDGRPIAGMDIDDIVNMIRGEEGTKVVLTIERTVGPDNVRTLDFPLVRARVDFPAVESRMLESPDKIGYVYLAEFYEKAADMLSDQLDDLKKQGMRALVLDMRDDPGGLLVQAMDVAGQFLDGKSVVIVRERNGEEQTLFARRSRYKELRVPLVVLVNSHSASASEIVAGALKDHKAATTVGDRTFGKGLVQTLEPLKGGSAVAITTARYFTPNHVNINPRRDADGNVIEGGLAPDIEVKQNPDYEYGKDETDWQLKKAVEVLRKQLRTGG